MVSEALIEVKRWSGLACEGLRALLERLVGAGRRAAGARMLDLVRSGAASACRAEHRIGDLRRCRQPGDTQERIEGDATRACDQVGIAETLRARDDRSGPRGRCFEISLGLSYLERELGMHEEIERHRAAAPAHDQRVLELALDLRVGALPCEQRRDPQRRDREVVPRAREAHRGAQRRGVVEASS
jgi:hypothetical protein